MAYTLQEVIDRAISVASRAADSSLTPALSAEMVTEDLLVQIFSKVSEQLAGSASQRHLLRRTKTVAFTTGTGVITEDVLAAYLCESSLYDTTDLAALYSYVPEWHDFVRSYDQRLGYYNVNESTIAVVQPAAVYTEGDGLTGDLVLVTPCAVLVPVTATTAITARDEVVERIIDQLAEALRVPAPRFRQVSNNGG